MGIGLELSRVFAANGHPLILVARSEDKLKALAGELTLLHKLPMLVVAADLTDPTAPRRISEAVAREGLTVDYLVNNAGIGWAGPFLETDVARSLDMIQVNITALTHLTQVFARGMLERKRGGVLNIASTAGFQPGPNMSVYYATKAYVIAFTEALAHELRPSGVHVTAFCPGPVATEFAKTAGNAESMLFKMGAAPANLVARDAYRAFMNHRVLAIQGLRNWLGVQLLRISPRALVRRLTAWLNSS